MQQQSQSSIWQPLIYLIMIGFTFIAMPQNSSTYLLTRCVQAIEVAFCISLFIQYFRQTIRPNGFNIRVNLWWLLYTVLAYVLTSSTLGLTPFFNWLNIIIFLLLGVCYWQHDIENSYKYIATTFSILIYLNAILFFLFPDGLWIDHNWQGTGDSTRHLFGNYNQTGFVCLIGITAQAMYTLTTKRGVFNLFALIIVSLGSVIYIGSMTSSIGLSILTIYIIFHKFIKRPKIYLTIFTVLYVLFFAVIIWYGNSIEEISLMTKFIENILSKDTTFTSRTYIWSNAVYKIQQSPWIGYGLQDVKWNMTYLAGSGPHNLLLTLLLQGGVILCGGFLINIIYVVREALKATNGAGVLGVVSICVLFLMSLFEAYNIVQTFLFLQLVYYSPLLNNYESRS